MVLDQSSVLQQSVWIGLPSEAPPALELAARVAQHTDLTGSWEVGAEPGEVETGIDQLDQHVPLAKEQDREPLGQPGGPDGRTERTSGPGFSVIVEAVDHAAGTGPGHQTPVGRIVVLASQVEVPEALLRFRYLVHVVRFAVVREPPGEREALGQPARAASREARHDDATPFAHATLSFRCNGKGYEEVSGSR